MQKIEQTREITDDGVSAERTSVTRTDTVATETQPGSIVAARVVWFIAGVIIALLAIRFALILLGANTGSPFVDFVYTLSYPFAVPFFGIFGYSLRYGVSQAELSSLVAIVIYALVAWGIARLLTIRRSDV